MRKEKNNKKERKKEPGRGTNQADLSPPSSLSLSLPLSLSLSLSACLPACLPACLSLTPSPSSLPQLFSLLKKFPLRFSFFFLLSSSSPCFFFFFFSFLFFLSFIFFFSDLAAAGAGLHGLVGQRATAARGVHRMTLSVAAEVQCRHVVSRRTSSCARALCAWSPLYISFSISQLLLSALVAGFPYY